MTLSYLLRNIWYVIPLGILILIIWGLYRVTSHDRAPKPMDPMNPVSLEVHSGPKEFFLHLLGFTTLYISAISLIGLLFQYVNKLAPDALSYRGIVTFNQLRWPMAGLIVIFPVFLIITRIAGNDMAQNPAKKEIKIYKFLLYFTLFVSAITIIVDLVTLVYNFLGGDLALNFFLKVIVVLLVALAIFGYYLWVLRKDMATVTGKRRMFMWISIVVVVISVAAGFFIVGTPMSQRKIRFDQQRISNLGSLSSEIGRYYLQNSILPQMLSQVPRASLYKDPETSQPYEYRVIDSRNFELCAVFSLASTDEGSNARPAYDDYYYDEYSNTTWKYAKGRSCFTRTAPALPTPTPTIIYNPTYPQLR